MPDRWGGVGAEVCHQRVGEVGSALFDIAETGLTLHAGVECAEELVPAVVELLDGDDVVCRGCRFGWR